jgi:hypothetical protein
MPNKSTTAKIVSSVTLLLLGVILSLASSISEVRFLSFVAGLERFGSTLAVLESVITFALAGALFWSIRKERRALIWFAGGIFTLLALAANMADYFGTLQISPGLEMEVSPIWNGLLKDTGMEFAKLFGFVGKVFVSFVAGASLVFYLRNVSAIMPSQQKSLCRLIFHLGERSNVLSARFVQFFTVLSFYFAAVNLFMFYVVYANSKVTDLHALSQLPPFPAAVCIGLIVMTAAFLFVTQRLQSSSIAAAGNC